jgi:hypothetical protein
VRPTVVIVLVAWSNVIYPELVISTASVSISRGVAASAATQRRVNATLPNALRAALQISCEDPQYYPTPPKAFTQPFAHPNRPTSKVGRSP